MIYYLFFYTHDIPLMRRTFAKRKRALYVCVVEF